MQNPTTSARLAFGLFEVDVQAGELWKSGFRVKLQSQPFKILVALLEQHGHVVTREDLQTLVWGKSTNVDFDHSLGTAVNKIREAIGDSADNPRFIETLARRGYRFIAPVQTIGEPEATPEATAPASPPIPAQPLTAFASIPALPATAAKSPWPLIAVAGLAASVITAGIVYRIDRAHPATVPLHISQITHSGHLASSAVTSEDIPAAAASDDVHIYATTLDHGQARLAAVSLPAGTIFPLDVPTEIASPAVSDISPDGSRLLVRDHLSPESEQPLWVIPTLGGSAQRVGNVLAHDATWMPDGQSILFANGNRLLLSTGNGQSPETFATLSGRAFWLRWSPDGSTLRFTVVDPLAHTISLWQLTAKDHTPTRLLANFNTPATECCGVWADGGRTFVFQSGQGGSTDLWRLDGASTEPSRVTDGPLEFQAPVASRTGSRIFFLGADSRSELDRLSPTGELVPERGLLADAARVEYSRDKKWVAWVDTSGHLWRARADGSERIQLTAGKMDVFLSRWSPDGTHLALMARVPGKVWTLYLLDTDGSNLRPLLNESRNAADPSWSADGNTLVFGRTNDRMGSESGRSLEYLDLRTGTTKPIPGSENLFSPRWSPDGRYIAALSLDQRHVSLFDVAAQTWRPLALASGADPVWSPDSRSFILHGALNVAQPIQRVSIPDGKIQTIAQLGTATSSNAVSWVLSGLALDGTPLVRTRMHTGDLFSLDLKR